MGFQRCRNGGGSKGGGDFKRCRGGGWVKSVGGLLNGPRGGGGGGGVGYRVLAPKRCRGGVGGRFNEGGGGGPKKVFPQSITAISYILP